MTADPQGEHLDVPPEYGTPSRVLGWAEVRARLEEAAQYWLATVRPDGRPHTVPTDGLWLDDAFWFGGSPQTVKHRNLLVERRVAVHLPDAVAAVIVEGRCEVVRADETLAARLVHASTKKYGYAPPAAVYIDGVWRLQPRKVMAWSSLPADATRFCFPSPVQPAPH